MRDWWTVRSLTVVLVTGLLVLSATLVVATGDPGMGAGDEQSTLDVPTEGELIADQGGDDPLLQPHTRDSDGPINYSIVRDDGKWLVESDLRSTAYQSFPRLFVGEIFAVEVNVSNDGDSVEDYEVYMNASSPLTSKSGTLGPGEETTVRLEVRFTSPGSATITVTNQSMWLRVYEPTEIMVSDLRYNNSMPSAGDAVTATAEVLNGPEAPPVDPRVEIRNDETGELIHSETVSLATGERDTVETTFTVEENESSYSASVWTDGQRRDVRTQYLVVGDWDGGDFNVTDEWNESDFNLSDDWNDSDFNGSEDWEQNLAEDVDPEYGDDGGSGFGLAVALLALIAFVGIRRAQRSPGYFPWREAR